MSFCIPLSSNIAQKPYVIGSLGPEALKYESFDSKGPAVYPFCRRRTDAGEFECTAAFAALMHFPNPQALKRYTLNPKPYKPETLNPRSQAPGTTI